MTTLAIAKEETAMAANTFEQVLEQARTLTPEEQQQLVRELTQPKLRTHNPDGSIRTMYDAMAERGLIGFMKDAPPDLSTNPKYMEGFGQHAE
jgi:hypothetical protein